MPTDALRAAERACAEAMEATGHLAMFVDGGYARWRWGDSVVRWDGTAPPFGTDPTACARLKRWAFETKRWSLSVWWTWVEGREKLPIEVEVCGPGLCVEAGLTEEAAVTLAIAKAIRAEGEA